MICKNFTFILKFRLWKGEFNAFLTSSVEENIATVTLNKPPANALSSQILVELSSVFDQLEYDDAVRVIVLEGQGRFFSAGADIKAVSYTHLTLPTMAVV